MIAPVVGLDIGATKTAVAVEWVVGRTPEIRQLPTGDWDASQPLRAARHVVRLVEAALPRDCRPASVGIGAQGCDTEEHCRRLETAIAALGQEAVVVNDSALLVPAAGLEEGIGVIAGTGAIATGRDNSGQTLFAGGWGWVLGDDAGAAGIVREATKAVLAAHDRGKPDDGLLGALTRAFDVRGAAALARAVNDTPTFESWAPHAAAVFAAADSGSSLAASVVDAGARHLAGLVGVLLDRGAVGRVVVAAGGVIVNQARLFERFRECLADEHPALEVRRLDVPPVVGALALARLRGDRRPRVPGYPNHGEEADATARTT